MHHYLFRRFKYVLILALALFLNSVLFAQISVRGKVADNNGLALPGVSVTEKGTSNGATSNVTGD
jgi:hypothetical protein